jgi:hypothetical protein
MGNAPTEDPSKSAKEGVRDFIGFVFLETLASPVATDGWQALKAGEVMKAVLLYGLAAVPCIAGLLVLGGAWNRTRSKIGSWLASWIAPVVSSAFSWFALFIVIFVYFATPLLLGQLKSILTETPSTASSVPSTKSSIARATEAWLPPEQAIELFVPVSDQSDLSRASLNLRKQLLAGQLIAEGYDAESDKYVEIPVETWKVITLVIRSQNTGGHLPGISAEAGGVGVSHRFLSVQFRRNCGAENGNSN